MTLRVEGRWGEELDHKQQLEKQGKPFQCFARTGSLLNIRSASK